jgi:hypothetical protein
LQVDEIAESRVLPVVRKLLSDRVQLLGDLPSLGEHQYEVWAVEPDRSQTGPGHGYELLIASLQWSDLELGRAEHTAGEAHLDSDLF